MTIGLMQYVDDCSSLKRQRWLVEYVMVGQGIVDTERAEYIPVTSLQAVCVHKWIAALMHLNGFLYSKIVSF